MPVPSDPSREDIILEGMKAGGQYTVTNSDARYTEFLADNWETLKTEIWNACRTDKLLEVEACVLATVGYAPITLPSEFDSEVRLQLFDGDDSQRGTAQTGASSSITLASDYSGTTADMYGRYVFTLTGTGSGQFRQITNYDDTTKIATVGSAWTTTPDSTTTYLIGITSFILGREDYARPTTPNRRPYWYSRVGPTLSVYPAGDKIYPIVLTYRSNLTRLNDTTDTTFLKHLRERRVLWFEGVKTKTLERYDDERYTQQKQVWERILAQYAGQNVIYTRMQGNR